MEHIPFIIKLDNIFLVFDIQLIYFSYLFIKCDVLLVASFVLSKKNLSPNKITKKHFVNLAKSGHQCSHSSESVHKSRGDRQCGEYVGAVK